MFESTLPFGEPELMRASAFQRYLDESVRSGEADSMASRLSTLSPSLMLDLMRFEQDGQQSGVVEVLAACVRHARKLLIHLQVRRPGGAADGVPGGAPGALPDADDAVPGAAAGRPERAACRAGAAAPARRPRAGAWSASPQHYSALGPLLWELALRGSRARAAARDRRPGGLPRRAGPEPARPGAQRLDGRGGGRDCKRDTTNLREMAQWPGFDRERAMRLLNGLYLQGGLMVSRTHPAATNEGWSSGRPQ